MKMLFSALKNPKPVPDYLFLDHGKRILQGIFAIFWSSRKDDIHTIKGGGTRIEIRTVFSCQEKMCV
jgi:hypothetical protein